MTNNQEDKLSMNLKVESVCDKFESVWSGNKAFKASYGVFKPNNRLIEQNRDIQITNITGVTSDKGIKRVIMSDKALYIANRMESFARVSANEELLANIHFTSSDMRNARDTDITGICDNVLSKAILYKANLVDYNVTDEMISDLQTSINNYTTVVTKPQVSRGELKNAGQNIVRLFKENDEILVTRMDLDIEVFKVSNPDFYRQYKTARIIINSGYQTTALTVSVKDADGYALPKVSATITNIPKNPNSKEVINEISKKTTVKGAFKVINLAEGNYKLMLSKLGFATQTVNFSVVGGETTKMDLVMGR